MINLRNVNKIYYQGKLASHVLSNINLCIGKGEFIAIMGTSGTGKSTLLNILGLMDEATSGEYLLDGIDIRNLHDNEKAELRNKRFGFIFQSFNLIFTKSVFENVILPLEYSTTKKKSYAKLAKDALAKVGLEKYSDYYPDELSGGQQQRVAIARAIVNNPDILLADEPTGNLDSKISLDIMNIISDIHKEKKTVILVTHDSKIAEYAENIYQMEDLLDREIRIS